MRWLKKLWPQNAPKTRPSASNSAICDALAAIEKAQRDGGSRKESEQCFLSVDLEFSDLDSKKGDILSIGWVEIQDRKLLLSSTRLVYVKNRNSVGQSAAIHEIRDQDAAAGLSLNQALLLFLKACVGKTLVLHHAKLDLDYLNRACLATAGKKLAIPVYDTLFEEQKRIQKKLAVIPQGALTLPASRDRYGLPAYPNHDALVDAIATGELFLAQMSVR